MDIFWNHTIQIALIQYSGQLKHAWVFSDTAKRFPKSLVRPAGCELWGINHVYFYNQGSHSLEKVLEFPSSLKSP